MQAGHARVGRGPLRSISGSMPLCSLSRPTRTSAPASRNRRCGQWTGKLMPLAPGRLVACTLS